jgi:hypothetical protein
MTKKETRLIDKTEYPPIEVYQLQPGTQLLIETQDESVHHLTIMDPVEGLVTASGGKLFQGGINVTLVGSYWDDGISDQRPGIVQKGLCIEFRVTNPEIKGKVHYVSTSPVVSTKIIGPDETWEFEMWEN